MRTTLTLDDDAIETVQAYAARNRISLSKAASELIRRGIRYQLPVTKVNGLPVFVVPDDFPLITTRKVRELMEDE
jgi:hypothetical protein